MSRLYTMGECLYVLTYKYVKYKRKKECMK